MMSRDSTFAKYVVEELENLRLTEDDISDELFRHTVNIILDKVATAVGLAETRLLMEETELLEEENEKAQRKFLEDHAVGNH